MWRADNGNINLVHPPDWSALLTVSDASLRSLSMLAHLGDASFERLVLALEEAVVRELDLTESSPPRRQSSRIDFHPSRSCWRSMATTRRRSLDHCRSRSDGCRFAGASSTWQLSTIWSTSSRHLGPSDPPSRNSPKETV